MYSLAASLLHSTNCNFVEMSKRISPKNWIISWQHWLDISTSSLKWCLITSHAISSLLIQKTINLLHTWCTFSTCSEHKLNFFFLSLLLDTMIPVNLELVNELWLPNIFIYNLKTFKVVEVLSKHAGLWITTNNDVFYSQATHITFICPMRFDAFPLDTQVRRLST